MLDNFALQRRQPADALLIVGREFIHHLHEQSQQGFNAIARDELREHDVNAVIAAGQMMQRPDPGMSATGGEKIHDAGLLLKPRDILEQLGRLPHIQWFEMLGLEEAKKGTGPAGKILHQPLRRGDDGELGMLLDEGPKLFLTGVPQPLKDGVKILHHHQERSGTERGEQMPGHEFLSVLRLQIIRRIKHVISEFSGITFHQGGVNFDEEFQQCGAGLVLVEPGDAQPVREFNVRPQTTDNEGDEMGFAAPPGTDEQQMVLVIGEGAFPHPLHRVLQQFLALNENELQILGSGPAGSEYRDGFVTLRPLFGVKLIRAHRPRLIFHQRRISGKRKR